MPKSNRWQTFCPLKAGPSKEQIAQALAVLVGCLQVIPVKGQNTTEEAWEEPSILTVLLLATFMIGVCWLLRPPSVAVLETREVQGEDHHVL